MASLGLFRECLTASQGGNYRIDRRSWYTRRLLLLLMVRSKYAGELFNQAGVTNNATKLIPVKDTVMDFY